MTSPKFTKAVRRNTPLRVGFSGPSGSGKTEAALRLARALVGEDGRIAVIDTEAGSASLYAGSVTEFDALELGPPYHTDRYLDAMQSAVDAGYHAVVVDSLSHQWFGEGGILQRKEALDSRPGSNSFVNWAKFTPEHEQFKVALLHFPVHLLATLRSKQDYVVSTNDKGKQMPTKVGLAPIQREGLEYEFTIVFDMQMDHRATASKDRTGLFSTGAHDFRDGDVGRDLLAWRNTGSNEPAPIQAEARLTRDSLLDFGRFSGMSLSACGLDFIAWANEDASKRIPEKWRALFARELVAREDGEPENSNGGELPLGVAAKALSTRIQD